MYFQNFIIFDLQEEGLFQINNVNKVVLQNIWVQNSKFQVNFIKITYSRYYESLLEVTKLNLFNISQSINQYDFACFAKPSLQPLNQLQCGYQSSINLSPSSLPLFDTSQKLLVSIQKCYALVQKRQKVQENSGLLFVNGLAELSKIIFNDIFINKAECSECELGLLSFQYILTKNTFISQTSVIQAITILNSSCGGSCFNLDKIIQFNSIRMLQIQQQITSVKEFQIKLYHCENNTANSAACLKISNINTFLLSSFFISNKVMNYGGAIFIQGNFIFLFNNCTVQNNWAEIGGGIYIENLPQVNYSQFNNKVQDNVAELEGENYKVQPNSLDFYLQKNTKLQRQTIISNSTIQIDQVLKNNQDIFLPSGQQMSSYKIFNKISSTYSDPNLKLSLRANQFDNGWSKNLNNTACLIQSRKINISNYEEEQEFTFNYTSIKSVDFNTETQDYNLDNLIIFFDPDLPKEIYLQLEFQCNAITVIQFEEKYPFKLQFYHNNYRLRLNIKTFPCQYGEIKNLTEQSCHVCDYINGFFSLKINQHQCQQKDDSSTLSVNSAMLQLKQGYWRPYFDSSYITYCYNFPTNCIGGWGQGDSSCIVGYIGALCEQCDIFNVRGNGNYVIIEEYKCGPCSNQQKIILLIIFTVFWTLTNLLISVQGNLKVQDDYAKSSLFYSYQLSKIINQSQTGILMKMLTNYLQIIASLSKFQLNFSLGFTYFLKIVGNPIQTTANSQDCLLINLFHTEIQYTRTIWLLFLPFLYIGANLFIFYVSSYFRLSIFNISIISTSILHIYLYFQPSMIENFMQLLSYREISGFKWVKANVASRYDTSEHFQWMISFALPFLILFSLFIPLFFLFHLFRNQEKQNKKDFKKIWGYLYHEYASKAYYWEIAKIFEKQLIIMFLSFFEEQITTKAVLIILVTLFYSQIVLRKQPYKIKHLNDLDVSSANVCTISICLALGIYGSQQQNSQEMRILFLLILGFTNFQFALVLVSKIINEYLRNFTRMIDIVQIRTIFPILKKIIKKLNRKKEINNYLKYKIVSASISKKFFEIPRMFIFQLEKQFKKIKYIIDLIPSITPQQQK